MKRYTGQKALYEAISRSCAKAKHNSILEKLRPEARKQEQPVGDLLVDMDPVPTVAAVPPPAEVAPPEKKPVFERKPEKAGVKEADRLAAKSERPAVKTRADEPKLVEIVSSALTPAPRRLRPKPLLLGAGRVEISVPYHIGVAVVLVAILMILAAFRIGQSYPGAEEQSGAPVNPPARAAKQNAGTETATAATKGRRPDASAAPAPPAETTPQQGDHWIVLAKARETADLEPVVEYFAAKDIALSIRELEPTRRLFVERGLNTAVLPGGDGYMLVTKWLYSNPDRPGSDGYVMKQRIVDEGKKYKAPQGRESFAATRFSDAYGMKISK